MKRLMVALVMVGLVVGICTWSIVEQRTTINDLLDEVDRLQEDCAAEDFDACLVRAERLAKKFSKRTAVLEEFMGHRALHGVHESLLVLPTMLKHEDHHNFAVRLKQCKLELEHLKTKGLPTLTNIL